MSRLKPEGLRTVCGGPFSFSVDRGECVALSGPSGCGKTLLLRALADLDPAEGRVELDGIDRNAIAAPEWRRQVGWLPAESSWWFSCVEDHFSKDWKNNFQTLEHLGFASDVSSWDVERLSTGERQRLALFRLLLNEPKVLLLDEPTAALDVSNVWKVEEVIEAYRKTSGAAVVWVSHDPEQILRTADRHLQFAENGLESV